MSQIEPERAKKAGGFLLAVSIIAGTIAGGMVREPSIGLLIGTAVGILLLIVVWLADRKR